jgi:hypothetical protein
MAVEHLDKEMTNGENKIVWHRTNSLVHAAGAHFHTWLEIQASLPYQPRSAAAHTHLLNHPRLQL